MEAVQLVTKLLIEMGSKRSWHRPIVRFAENTILPYLAPPDATKRLNQNDIFFIDIGPTWQTLGQIEYEGDVGNTFVIGNNKIYLDCAEAARSLFRLARNHWASSQVTGDQLYKWLENEAEKRNYSLVKEDDGHRIGEFPHKTIFSGPLSAVKFHPTGGLWVLEVHIIDSNNGIGAFYEDILR